MDNLFVFYPYFYDFTIILGFVFIALTVYYVFFKPIQLYDKGSSLEDMYSRQTNGVGRPSISSPIISNRRQGVESKNFPPSFPNGWYRVLQSRDLPKGSVRSVEAFGLQLVAWRGKDGEVSVVDAFCPHLGAHLGLGSVVGKSLRCPFHFWEFEPSGSCSKVPYDKSGKPPTAAKLRHWTSVEVNGCILVWHHSSGSTPTYEPFPIFSKEDIDNGDWVFHGISKRHISVHVQDIAENGPDKAHLNVLHTSFAYQIGRLLGFGHSWDAEWITLPEPQTHMSQVKVYQRFTFLGKPIPGPLGVVNSVVVQDGLGAATITVNFPLLGKMSVIQTVTPIWNHLTSMQEAVYTERWVPRWLGRLWLIAVHNQVDHDVIIWNTKTYMNKPVLVSNDGPISAFRRWCKQFYDDNSTVVHKERTANLDW